MQSDLFEGASTVAVSQKKEWLEILTDFEHRNAFTIDFDGRDGVLLAAEEGSRWKRFFMGSMRPYTLVIQTREKKPVLRMHSPFRWIHPEITVMDPNRKPLGSVRKRWSGFGREMFTDAQHFQLSFPEITDPTERKILLGALFLIDFTHFEDSGS